MNDWEKVVKEGQGYPCFQHDMMMMMRARGPVIIPSPPIVALTEFFHADAMANVHPSIASIVIFNIVAMSAPVFLYAYYVYVMTYHRCCQLR